MSRTKDEQPRCKLKGTRKSILNQDAGTEVYAKAFSIREKKFTGIHTQRSPEPGYRYKEGIRKSIFSKDEICKYTYKVPESGYKYEVTRQEN